MKVHLIASITTILLISGCSSTPEVPTSESFVTDITELGHKRFTYKASLGAGPSTRGGRRNKPSRGPGMGGGGKPPGGRPDNSKATSGDIKKTATERIELLLSESGFCPNGWFLIEQTFDQSRAEILGECRVAAPQ